MSAKRSTKKVRFATLNRPPRQRRKERKIFYWALPPRLTPLMTEPYFHLISVAAGADALWHSNCLECTLYLLFAPPTSTSSRFPRCSQLGSGTLNRSNPVGPPRVVFVGLAIST